MIPEFGQFSLILALCLAVMQSVLPLIGTARGNIALMNSARSTAFGQFFFLFIAFICLAIAFLTSDFSVTYVAENSNTQLPLIYKFCAIWGSHEGSILLWVVILSLWMALVSVFSRSLPLETVSRVLAILGMISAGLLLFILFTSNPFARLLGNIPTQGNDLNPLLQDPGLVSHPPLLYMGYVGFAVPFAFAISALLGGRLDAVWARWSRPWTQVAWCFLTAGIVLGSWWSYRELGWGGWWSWDPVENASFMPWLAGTALIHSLAATEKRNVFKAWTVLLAIATFSLSLIGTFLVRSGVLISVHAFAVDAERGTFLLYFLSLVIGLSLLLYAWRASAVKSSSRFKASSLETFLLCNNIFLSVIMLTVLLGTLYPLLIQIMGLGKLSVGPPYFNSVFIPLILPLLVVMGFGPLARWKHIEPKLLFKQIWLALLVSIIIAPLLLLLLVPRLHFLVLLMTILALWVIIGSLQELFDKSNSKKRLRLKSLSRTHVGKILAHFGLGVCAIGIAISSAYSVQRDVAMSPHDTIKLASYELTFLGVKNLSGPNYAGVSADMLVSQNNHQISVLHPEIRSYMADQTSLPHAALTANLFRDVYISLGEQLKDNSWSMRIYYKPLIRWIWWGGLLMVLGALLAASDKRYRRLKKSKDN